MSVPGPIILVLALIGWVFTAILARAAWIRPRIPPLSERAIAGTVISSFVTVYGLVASNTDAGFFSFDASDAKAIVRLLVLVVGLLPIVWGVLYLSGHLGGTEE